MFLLDKQPKRGQKITYQKEFMFKGYSEITTKIVAVYGNTILCENGDNITWFLNK